jgi:hypothetical protein
MITLLVIMSLLVISLAAAFASSNIYDLTKLGPVSNTIEINRETPDAILAEQMCKGNISRDTYELFVAEKLDLKLI